MHVTTLVRNIRRTRRDSFLRPQLLAFLPALGLGGYWFGAEGVLLIAAVTLPILLILGGIFEAEPAEVDELTGMRTREGLIDSIDDALEGRGGERCSPVVIALEIDDFDEVRRLGPKGMEEVLCRTADRIAEVTRRSDIIGRLGEGSFGIRLTPPGNAGMEIGIRATERIQAAIAEPISIDATNVYVSATAGFCLARRAPEPTGQAILEAAEVALADARGTARGSLRTYSSEMQQRLNGHVSLAEDLARALEAGEIVPWFQPQIETGSGTVTGFEALVRWQHPERGIISPGDFLPAAEASGLMERLGEVVLYHALSALRSWDKAGLPVPHVGVNMSVHELRNPHLVDRIRWELDRFDIAPERLAIEVLETVVADSDSDSVTTNIANLAKLGCTIDLDDFGTGHASIANIRRFAVSRLKIDRSFVTKADSDPGQRQMLSATLKMAQELRLDTLAEGVETAGERAVLADLGCQHLQGFGIARPMPADQAISWLATYRAGLASESQIAAGQVI